jgi:hypothetical protein
MPSIESVIENSNKLTDIFGYWPSFHDAEVIDLHLWRGHLEPEKNVYQFPVLTIRFHLSELAKDNTEGHLIMKHHTLAALRFHDLDESNEFRSFNYQNVIFELRIEKLSGEQKGSNRFDVWIDPSMGIGANFKCRRIEVLDCTPCDENGNPWPDNC